MFTWQNYHFIHIYTSKQKDLVNLIYAPLCYWSLTFPLPHKWSRSNKHPVHLYLPQVTRKIIRKCISDEGVQHEREPLEEDPQGTISMTAGDGYSKVVKRTVIKSEGDHSEVCAVYRDCVMKMSIIFMLMVLCKLQFYYLNRWHLPKLRGSWHPVKRELKVVKLIEWKSQQWSRVKGQWHTRVIRLCQLTCPQPKMTLNRFVAKLHFLYLRWTCHMW